MVIPSFIQTAETEFGDTPNGNIAGDKSTLIIASYNIRYAVGQFLISSGLLRKAGFNLPNHRANAVAENIRAAASAFSAGKLLPPVDILALQEADKRTGRAGEHHVARELAEQLQMAWVHVAAGIPRGQEPMTRQWWLDFEEQIALHDPGDTGVAMLSRFPLEDVTRIDLPWHECPWRPRLSLAATVKLRSHAVRIFNSHIDPHSKAGGRLSSSKSCWIKLISFQDHEYFSEILIRSPELRRFRSDNCSNLVVIRRPFQQVRPPGAELESVFMPIGSSLVT